MKYIFNSISIVFNIINNRHDNSGVILTLLKFPSLSEIVIMITITTLLTVTVAITMMIAKR